MNYDKIVFVDLETSGFDTERQDIIQVSAVDCFTGEKFNEYVRFKINEANPRALELNSYDEDLWDEKAISQRRAFYTFQDWLSKRRYCIRKKNEEEYQTTILAGHNIGCFDIPFLREWEYRFSESLKIDYAHYDTLPLARWILPELDSHSLESLCKFYKLESKGMHDSLTDTLLNIQVAYNILKRIGIQPKWHPSLLP